MNKTIKSFAQTNIIEGLKLLSYGQVKLFKRMYAKSAGLTVDDSIPDIVKSMPEDKLDWALTQVERTIEEKYSK